MALTDENSGGIGATMLVGPTGGYPMYGNNGMGFGGDWWGILLLIALLNGGFGGFGGFGGGYGNMMLGYDFPWLLNGQQNINANTNSGFRDAMLNDGITSVRDGINGLSTQLCGCCGDIQMALANGFAGTTAAVTGAQNAVTQQLYNNEIGSLNRSFAAQTANAQGFNALQGQLAQCCCDNRLASADLKYTIATENCADRAALSDGIRDILAATQAQTQALKDQLCEYRNEQKDDIIAQLRSELIYARGQASQDVQTARILAGQATQTDAIYNRFATCPVNTVPVYGSTPIWGCTQNVAGNNCGCNGTF